MPLDFQLEQLKKEGWKLRTLTDEQGRNYQPSITDKEQLLVVIDGQIIVWINRDQAICQAGKQVIIPARTLFWMQVGADGCVYLLGER